MTDQATIDKLLAAGIIECRGGGFVKTAKGAALLREGVPRRIPGYATLKIDSVLARSKPSIAKVKKRKK